MEVDCIDYKDTNYFSKLVIDYLDKQTDLSPFFQHSPEIDSFEKAINDRQFSHEKRMLLTDVLQKQYEKGKIKLNGDSAVQENITALQKSNTFTVTTGHQLSLFTGPLYFIYKIVSTIKLSQRLSNKFPDKNFVPVYWMATEDHDFEEISFFNFKNKKLQWGTDQEGAVGRMSTAGLKTVFDSFKELLTPYSTNAEHLISLFENAYLKHQNLADASRYLVNALFADYGLLILDGDDKKLKELFIPQLKEELQDAVSSSLVSRQNEELGKSYKIQVNPREINLFYLEKNSRKRILKQEDTFFIDGTDQKFKAEEFYDILEKHPQRFSPNVLLRPVYQEVVLPNLAYIGGGGELAYWFQLKSTFNHFSIPLPILLLRNSALWMDRKTKKYINELKLSKQQIFLAEGVLFKEWVKSNADHDLTLDDEIYQQKEFFKLLSEKAATIDPTLKEHTLAVAEKQKQKIEQLSEKLLRAERHQQQTAEQRIKHLKSFLFPNRSLQEREENFSLLYMVYGDKLIEKLLAVFEVPTKDFKILKEK